MRLLTPVFLLVCLVMLAACGSRNYAGSQPNYGDIHGRAKSPAAMHMPYHYIGRAAKKIGKFFKKL